MANTQTGEQSNLPAQAKLANLGEPAAQLVAGQPGAREALQALMDAGLLMDAVRLFAILLPRREAVWWGWTSVRRTAEASQGEKAQASLKATETWLTQPTDENRRAAMAAALEADPSTPAGCAGFAAFLSGGSLAPPDLPEVPPAAHLAGKAVAGAIILCAVSKPEEAPSRFRAFLAQGFELAGRISLWRKKED